MPRKPKEPKKSFALKHWRSITAVVSVAILLSGLGVVANEQYLQGQISAANAAKDAIELGQTRVDEVSDLLDILELAILNAEEIAAETQGKTLENNDREALLAEI